MAYKRLPEYQIFDKATGERLHPDRQFSATSAKDMKDSYEDSYGGEVIVKRAR